jgi:hypothetical protein
MATATRKPEELGRMSRYMYRELCGAFGRQVHEQDAELWQNQDGSVWIIYVEGCRPDALIDSLKNDMQIMNEWYAEKERKDRERLAGQPVWQ